MRPRLVLASSSPRRADVLRQLRLAPEILPASIDESYEPGETAAEHVERLARCKAQAVALREPDALVVAGDTIVADGERLLVKPTSPDEAASMLLSLSGRTHDVMSGLALSGPHGTVSGVARARVRFRSFDGALARRYVASGEPMDKAGGYGIQGLGATLVEAIEGDYYSVVGFPVGVFVDLLERAGWRYDFGSLTRLPG